MFELRWLFKEVIRTDCKTTKQHVLQYRTRIPYISFGDIEYSGWSDWKDVPIVEE